MLISPQNRKTLETIFETIKLKNSDGESGIDKKCKIEQIFSYLEMIHSNLRKYSLKRKLVLIDSGAGNCYLSFLVFYFYTKIEQRNITIHCVDTNESLMDKCRDKAQKLGFNQIFFHVSDILDFQYSGKVDIVYSLHACNSATDKTLYFGITHNAATILSVSCCQHDIKKRMRNRRYAGITKHSVFKDRFVYMVGDSLRALLLETVGYKSAIFEFVSSRYTDKNIMLRAKKSSLGRIEEIKSEYEKIKNEFCVSPELETYLTKST